jgi:hypothetical protein
LACEPDIDNNLPVPEKKVIVDGWIEQNNFAYVILTYNSPYFSNLDSASFRALVATRAKVTISDGQNYEILTLMKDTNYFPPYIYRGTELKGEIGKTYFLSVVDDKDTLYASTTIERPVNIDSIWFESNTPGDSMGVIKGIFSDNANEKNYYRTFTEIKNSNKLYIPTLVSNYDDKYFNGQKFTFTLERGPESYLKPLENIYFKKGDTIFVKISSVDEHSFRFWSSYQTEVLNSGNPFAASHNTIESNITGGLGIWCGYGSDYYLVIAK